MGKLGKPVTQRQLRVGEMIKQALSKIGRASCRERV